jgi:hypothetical protein
MPPDELTPAAANINASPEDAAKAAAQAEADEQKKLDELFKK